MNVIEELEVLLRNAEELNEQHYVFVFTKTIALIKTSEDFKEISQMQEKKLQELMGREAYLGFADECAKKLFASSLKKMPNSEFKDFCEKNFDTITHRE